jgi:hypothetical protein
MTSAETPSSTAPLGKPDATITSAAPAAPAARVTPLTSLCFWELLKARLFRSRNAWDDQRGAYEAEVRAARARRSGEAVDEGYNRVDYLGPWTEAGDVMQTTSTAAPAGSLAIPLPVLADFIGNLPGHRAPASWSIRHEDAEDADAGLSAAPADIVIRGDVAHVAVHSLGGDAHADAAAGVEVLRVLNNTFIVRPVTHTDAQSTTTTSSSLPPPASYQLDTAAAYQAELIKAEEASAQAQARADAEAAAVAAAAAEQSPEASKDAADDAPRKSRRREPVSVPVPYPRPVFEVPEVPCPNNSTCTSSTTADNGSDSDAWLYSIDRDPTPHITDIMTHSSTNNSNSELQKTPACPSLVPYYLSGPLHAPLRHYAPETVLVEYNGGLATPLEFAEHAWGLNESWNGFSRANANAGTFIRGGKKRSKTDNTDNTSSIATSSTDGTNNAGASAAGPDNTSATTTATSTATSTSTSPLPPPLLSRLMCGRAAEADPLFPARVDALMSALGVAEGHRRRRQGLGQEQGEREGVNSLYNNGFMNRYTNTGAFVGLDGQHHDISSHTNNMSETTDFHSLSTPEQINHIAPNPSLPLTPEVSRLDVISEYLHTIERHIFDESLPPFINPKQQLSNLTSLDSSINDNKSSIPLSLSRALAIEDVLSSYGLSARASLPAHIQWVEKARALTESLWVLQQLLDQCSPKEMKALKQASTKALQQQRREGTLGEAFSGSKAEAIFHFHSQLYNLSTPSASASPIDLATAPADPQMPPHVLQSLAAAFGSVERARECVVGLLEEAGSSVVQVRSQLFNLMQKITRYVLMCHSFCFLKIIDF